MLFVQRIGFALGFLGGLYGCTHTPAPSAPIAPHTRPNTVEHTTLDTGKTIGLSALTQDPTGHFWAVSERNRVLLQLDFSSSKPSVTQTLPLKGIPEGTDTEALAYIGGGVFVLGTETHTSHRNSDLLYFARNEANTLEVYDSLTLPYSLWSIEAEKNRGIEGLCYAEGHLMVASETVGTDNGKRFAPLARYETLQDVFIPYKLWLTTQEGKISALACGSLVNHDMLEVFAIERHYGSSVLLRFLVPLYPEAADIAPEVVVDIHETVGNPLPNFEGVVRTHTGGFILLSDSSNGGTVSQTHVLRIQKP
jgi:hypothetical protein